MSVGYQQLLRQHVRTHPPIPCTSRTNAEGCSQVLKEKHLGLVLQGVLGDNMGAWCDGFCAAIWEALVGCVILHVV